MNRKSRISFGPGAASLILIVVVLSMSVLGILALMNARSDSRLSTRSVQVIEAVYALNAQAERSLAALDEAAVFCAKHAGDDETYADTLQLHLPSGMRMEGREVFWTETDGYRSLDCAVTLAPLGESPRLSWKRHRLTATTEDTWN